MNDRRGQMIATSVGATAMGRGCDTAILDDPVSATKALSDSERTRANAWIDATLRSRLNDPAIGAIVVVMQRLHEFLDSHSHSAGSREGRDLDVSISGRVVQRKAGEILMPDRFRTEVVQQLRSRRMVFAGQYQQRPAPAEGNLIKRSEIRYYDGIDPRTGFADERLPGHFDRKIISVDCAFKDVATADYVAILVVGVKGSAGWQDRAHVRCRARVPSR